MTYQEHQTVAEHQHAASAENASDSDLVAKKVTRAVWIFASILDVLLGFRFLLKLFAANPDNPFARLVYATTDFLVYPFHNLVTNPSIGNGVFEFTTIIAILVYLFLTWLAIQLAILIFNR
jgi:uncharacterized protein YggT (Ycf19 family)